MPTTRRVSPPYRPVRRSAISLLGAILLAALLGLVLYLFLGLDAAPGPAAIVRVAPPPVPVVEPAPPAAPGPPPIPKARPPALPRAGPEPAAPPAAQPSEPAASEADAAATSAAEPTTPSTAPPAEPAAPARLRGWVVDEHGIGIGGAEVTAYHVGGVEVDESFVFEIPENPGAEQSGELRAATLARTLYLQARRSQAGLDEARAAVAQLSGRTFTLSGDRFVDRSSRAGATRTETDGSFELSGLAPGRYYVTARAERYLEGSVQADADESGSAVAEIALELGAEAEGVVVDAVTGAPIPLASVTANHAQTGEGASTQTDEAGAFTLTGLRPGPWHFGANAGGYVPLASAGRAEAPTEARVSAGAARVRIELRPEASFAGRVTDLRGEPVEGARVFALDGARIAGQDTAGADGTYRVDGLAEGEYEIYARSDDYTQVARLRVAVREGVGVEALDIALEPAGAIEGRLVSSDGRPLADAQVSASVAGSGQGQRAASTDADGWFRIENLYEERYELTASPQDPDGVGYLAPRAVCDVPAGAVVRQDLVASLGAVVRGRVLLPDGSPAPPGAIVWIGRGAATSQATTTQDETGAFEVGGVTPGDLIVLSRSGWDALARRELRIGPGAVIEGFDIRLGPPGVLRGRVLDPNGAPAAGIRIAVTDLTGLPVNRSGTTDADGRFEVGALYDGSYLAMPDGDRDAARPFGVAGAAAPAEIVLHLR